MLLYSAVVLAKAPSMKVSAWSTQSTKQANIEYLSQTFYYTELIRNPFCICKHEHNQNHSYHFVFVFRRVGHVSMLLIGNELEIDCFVFAYGALCGAPHGASLRWRPEPGIWQTLSAWAMQHGAASCPTQIHTVQIGNPEKMRRR
jgi:hypothetical protein